MTLKKQILFRAGVVYVACLLFALIILGRVIQLQLVQGSFWREKAETLTLNNITITPERGNIVDEEGRLLASSVPYYDIYIDMKCPGLTQRVFNSNVDSLSLQLSRLFKNKSKSQYKSDLVNAYKNGRRYYPVKRRVNFLQLKECKKFPIFRLGRYKGGVIYTQENIRVNPHNKLAERTLGYLNKGASGNVVGLEGAYDGYLRGVEGVRLMQLISGNTWMPVNDHNAIEPKDGMDIITSININLQDVAHYSLMDQLKKFDAEYGCVILMEVKTGEVKAIVNLKKTGNGAYAETYNYAIGKSSEPGSTFKLPVLMAAMEDGLIDLEDTVDTRNGSITYYDKKVTDSEGYGHGWVSVKKAFEISSNVGVSSIINSKYKGRERQFVDRLYQMGLNKKLGVEIKGEPMPTIKYPGDKLWSGVSLPQMSLGYEVRLTPLQTLAFYNAVANDGKMVKPKFVKGVYYHGKKEKKFQSDVINPSICSRSTIKKAQEMLLGVVENGTAKSLRNTPFKIAGKTGTAKLYDKEKGIYVSEYEASFVGYFPADEPQYSCIVIIHKPRTGGYYGAEVAAPVFKEIANKVYANKLGNLNEILMAENKKAAYTKAGNGSELEYVLQELGIQLEKDTKEPDWVVTRYEEDKVVVKTKKVIANLVPDVTQMGVKDALYLLENAGLRVKVNGRGTVLKQSIPPGSKIVKNQWIELQMSVI